MTANPLKINFQLERGVDSAENFMARFEFWQAPSTAQWFREHGYVLFQKIKEDWRIHTWRPTIPCDNQVESDYPYAHYDGSVDDQSEQISLRACESQGKVCFAQDLLNRHVAIKIVHTNSDELKICQFLREQDLETLKENCIIPVLDILPAEGFHFVVMPRWGERVLLPWPKNARGLIHFMHSMLKGINFLHKNNIAHLDLNAGNMLVNHFDDACEPNVPTMREDLQAKGSLLFALFDFDFSIKLPSQADRSRFKLPMPVCWKNNGLRTETAEGEPFINPFVLDIGALGYSFCTTFQHLTGTIPLLAPFIDKLMGRPLSARFSAEEALAFFENNFLTMSDSELDAPVEPFQWTKHADVDIFDYDRWADVPPDFAQKWAHLREPPVSWYTALLRRVVWTKLGAHIVYWVRWIFERPWGQNP